MIVKVHRIGPVVGRVVWPLVMKVFVTGITQNCCKWFSRTNRPTAPTCPEIKNPLWLWHFLQVGLLPMEFHHVVEPLNRNPRNWRNVVLCRKLLVSNISFMRKRNLGSDNNRLCQHDISRVGKQNILKSQLKCLILAPTFLVHFANNRRWREGEAFKLQPVLTRPSRSCPLPASCSNDLFAALSLLDKLERSAG